MPHMFRLGQQKTVEGAKGSDATIPETTSLALLCFAISWELDQQSKYWIYSQGYRNNNDREEYYFFLNHTQNFVLHNYYINISGVIDKS